MTRNSGCRSSATEDAQLPSIGSQEQAGAVRRSASSAIVHRQMAAVIWIAVAWMAGTVVFELTATGGETRPVVLQREHQPLLSWGDSVAADSETGENRAAGGR